MPRVEYEEQPMQAKALGMIDKINDVIRGFAEQGFDLTLRQLYYQFVARDLFPEDRKWTWTGKKWVLDPVAGTINADPNYKWLGDLVNRGRLAGLIDWMSIVDRTRNLHKLSVWDDASDIIRSAALGFRTDLWASQENYVEVWIEKDALSGVFQGVCDELRVPLFACKGNVSQSEQWAAGMRLWKVAARGACRTPIILHFGDHDPSGLDMTRDIERRLRMFMSDPDGGDDQSERLVVERLALNMDQILRFNPPPNPAKTTDSRYKGYVKKHNTTSSWELDALDPGTLAGLVRDAVARYRDEDKWAEAEAEESHMREDLIVCSARWPAVSAFLNGRKAK